MFAKDALESVLLPICRDPHPAGSESRRMGSKKPATELVTGFSDSVVPPAGFEPAISTLKELEQPAKHETNCYFLPASSA